MYGSCHPIQNHMWKLTDCQNVTFANRELKMYFIFEKIWEKFIRITIYKFKMNNHLWQIYGSCHPVRRNVKIVHLKTGSVKCRIWKQGVGCKYVCLNCKNIFFWQLYGSCHLVQRSTQTHMKIVLPKTGSVKNENTVFPSIMSGDIN